MGCAIRDADTALLSRDCEGVRRVSINPGTDGDVVVAEETPMKVSPESPR